MIGKGKIGTEGFRNLIQDRNFKDTPMIMETPLGEDGYESDILALNQLMP
jgi:Endonuclease IV